MKRKGQYKDLINEIAELLNLKKIKNKKILIFISIFFILIIAVIATVLSNKEVYEVQTYYPPAKIGQIYTVVDRKTYTDTITLKLEWGKINKKEKIGLSNSGRDSYKGFVLCIQHLQEDKWPLTIKVNSKEAILNVPQQGDPPKQWNDSSYKQVSW